MSFSAVVVDIREESAASPDASYGRCCWIALSLASGDVGTLEAVARSGVAADDSGAGRCGG